MPWRLRVPVITTSGSSWFAASMTACQTLICKVTLSAFACRPACVAEIGALLGDGVRVPLGARVRLVDLLAEVWREHRVARDDVLHRLPHVKNRCCGAGEQPPRDLDRVLGRDRMRRNR